MKTPEGQAKAKDLGSTIINGVVESDHAKDLTVELGDIALNQVLDEGLWHEVPVIRSVIGIVRTVGHVRDALFVKKVATFLLACPKFTAEERDEFIRENLAEGSEAKKLGDTLVLMLDKLDDLDKPQLLAKVFAALIRGKIDLPTFRRLAIAIDIGFVEDLTALVQIDERASGKIGVLCSNLLRTGLTELNGPITAPMEYGVPQVCWQVSKLGRRFIECLGGNAATR